LKTGSDVDAAERRLAEKDVQRRGRRVFRPPSIVQDEFDLAFLARETRDCDERQPAGPAKRPAFRDFSREKRTTFRSSR
jgi:hypothetical protein